MSNIQDLIQQLSNKVTNNQKLKQFVALYQQNVSKPPNEFFENAANASLALVVLLELVQVSGAQPVVLQLFSKIQSYLLKIKPVHSMVILLHKQVLSISESFSPPILQFIRDEIQLDLLPTQVTEIFNRLLFFFTNCREWETEAKISLERILIQVLQRHDMTQEIFDYFQHILTLQVKVQQPRLSHVLIISTLQRAKQSEKREQLITLAYKNVIPILNSFTTQNQFEKMFYLVQSSKNTIAKKIELTNSTSLESFLLLHQVGLDSQNYLNFCYIFQLLKGINLANKDQCECFAKMCSDFSIQQGDQAQAFAIIALTWIFRNVSIFSTNFTKLILDLFLNFFIKTDQFSPSHYVKLAREDYIVQHFIDKESQPEKQKDPFFFLTQKFINDEQCLTFIHWDDLKYFHSYAIYYMLNSFVDKLAKHQLGDDKSYVDSIFSIFKFFATKYQVFDAQLPFMWNMFDICDSIKQNWDTDKQCSEIVQYLVELPNKYVDIKALATQQKTVEQAAAIQNIILDQMPKFDYFKQFDIFNTNSFMILYGVLIFSQKSMPQKTTEFCEKSYSYIKDFENQCDVDVFTLFIQQFRKFYMNKELSIYNFDLHIASILKLGLTHQNDLIKHLLIYQLTLEFKRTDKIKEVMNYSCCQEFQPLLDQFNQYKLQVLYIIERLFIYQSIINQGSEVNLSRIEDKKMEDLCMNIADIQVVAQFQPGADNAQLFEKIRAQNYVKWFERYIFKDQELLVFDHMLDSISRIFVTTNYYGIRIYQHKHLLDIFQGIYEVIENELPQSYIKSLCNFVKTNFGNFTAPEQEQCVLLLIQVIRGFALNKIDVLCKQKLNLTMIVDAMSKICKVTSIKEHVILIITSLLAIAQESENIALMVGIIKRMILDLFQSSLYKDDKLNSQMDTFVSSFLAVFITKINNLDEALQLDIGKEVFRIIADFIAELPDARLQAHSLLSLSELFSQKMNRCVQDQIYEIILNVVTKSPEFISSNIDQNVKNNQQIVVNLAKGLRALSQETVMKDDNIVNAIQLLFVVIKSDIEKIESLRLLCAYLVVTQTSQIFMHFMMPLQQYFSQNKSDTNFIINSQCIVVESCVLIEKFQPLLLVINLINEQQQVLSVEQQASQIVLCMQLEFKSGEYVPSAYSEIVLLLLKQINRVILMNNQAILPHIIPFYKKIIAIGDKISLLFLIVYVSKLLQDQSAPTLRTEVLALFQSLIFALMSSESQNFCRSCHYFQMDEKVSPDIFKDLLSLSFQTTEKKIYTYNEHLIIYYNLQLCYYVLNQIKYKIDLKQFMIDLYIKSLQLFTTEEFAVEMNQFQFLNIFFDFFEKKEVLKELFEVTTRAIIGQARAKWWMFKYLQEIEGICGFE